MFRDRSGGGGAPGRGSQELNGANGLGSLTGVMDPRHGGSDGFGASQDGIMAHAHAPVLSYRSELPAA